MPKDKHDIDDDPMFATTRAGANDLRLAQFLERIERLTEEKKGIADDIKDVFSEAKGSGLDTKVMRRMLVLRRMEAEARNEMLSTEQLYADELGIGL